VNKLVTNHCAGLYNST